MNFEKAKNVATIAYLGVCTALAGGYYLWYRKFAKNLTMMNYIYGETESKDNDK